MRVKKAVKLLASWLNRSRRCIPKCFCEKKMLFTVILYLAKKTTMAQKKIWKALNCLKLRL
jgi:hypothetical protein